jgi:histidinol-phosphate/aromatic aminotransferase/cobyric acid decarboxylase-like protein
MTTIARRPAQRPPRLADLVHRVSVGRAGENDALLAALDRVRGERR